MTCADNCSSCSHDRAAVAAAASERASERAVVLVATGRTGLGLRWQRVSPVRPSRPRYPAVLPFCTTNQIQMHIPSSQRTHTRTVDEIMVDCTLHRRDALARASATPSSYSRARSEKIAPTGPGGDGRCHVPVPYSVMRASINTPVMEFLSNPTRETRPSASRLKPHGQTIPVYTSRRMLLYIY